MTKFIPIYLVLCAAMLTACNSKTTAEKQEEVMAESLAWQRAENKDTEYHYLKYGDLFPNGSHIDEVEERFEAIDPGSVTKDELLAKRFTGFIEQFDEKEVLSLRFNSMVEEEESLEFECIINTGPIGKKLNGIIDLESNIIQFYEHEGDEVQVKLVDGRIYVREDKIILESTELDQYWVLD